QPTPAVDHPPHASPTAPPARVPGPGRLTRDRGQDVSVELRERLIPLFGGDIAIERLALLAGGASKEAWALDLRTPQGTRLLLVRRAGGGVIHQQTLSLEHEGRLHGDGYADGSRRPRALACEA